MTKNQIEKNILLQFPLQRVWSAITDAKQFGYWFGMRLDGPFRSGEKISGAIHPTAVDDETAKLQKPYSGQSVELVVGKIEPMKRFELKWHPFAIDPQHNYSTEPMTLISFVLQEQADATFLTIREEGFEGIPESRRAEAMKANDGGWEHQTRLLKRYLELGKTP